MTPASRLAHLGFALVLMCLVCAAPVFGATAQLRGTVVSTLPAQGQVVVRHEAVGGMPAMTMLFHVTPAVLAQLHAGDRITARTDFATDPAPLTEVRVVGHVAVAPEARVLHDVPPLAVGNGLPADVTFFDQNGRAFTFNEFRGKTLLLAFVYTRCQDARMCPLISSNFHQLQNKLAGLPIHLIEITLDPAYDTPEVLKRYGKQFGEDPSFWTLGTGPVRQVQDFAARFGIAVFEDPRQGLIHTERIAVVDRNGQIVDLMDEAAWAPDDVAAKLRSVASLPSNPFARLSYELEKTAVAICGDSLPGTSGLFTLAVALGVFVAGAWILWRIGHKIFVEEP